jgi:hypothetical protein
MRVVVTGGRDFSDSDLMEDVLKQFPITALAHGGATGADALAGDYAAGHGIRVAVYKADWDKHGRAAGPIRNRFMLENFKPNLVVVFPGGRGTQNCYETAVQLGIETYRVS